MNYRLKLSKVLLCDCREVMSSAMASDGDSVKVEGGHVSVTTISMSGPETSNGKQLHFYRIKFRLDFFFACQQVSIRMFSPPE